MTTMNAPQRYGRLSISLHWLMLLLIAAVYALMEFRGYFPRGSATREAMKLWHYMLGLAVLALVFVRIAARFLSPTPPIVPAISAPQAWAAKLLHLALYALMICLPLVGWTILSAEGNAVPFFGMELPPLTVPDKATAESMEDLHELGGKIGYALIGLHALAALFHHYVQKDNTLRRMLPGRG
jgi:superoxide oxidase